MRSQPISIRDAATGGWVIIAPDRRKRRNAFGLRTALLEADCPFCPGHEAETPPEITRVGAADQWSIRVVPNRYPAVDSGHEVIIETRDHEVTFDALDPSHAAEIVRMYIDRYKAQRVPGQVLIFKNEGARSGASISHPHSQLIALERRTPRLEAELSLTSCPRCSEAASTERIITRSESFVVIAPYASRFAYEMAIVPLEHEHNFTAARGRAPELARLMQRCVGAMRLGAGTTAYNWIFMNAAASFHWYLEIIPRLTVPGGFEVGSGSWINIVPPESAAQELRPFFTE
jgi:UDPglucose--hexose-1-phosphate uridylyltransferase